MGRFIRYYKWHLIFFMVILSCVAYILISVTSRTVPDMTIGFAGSQYVRMEIFNDTKYELEQLLHDSNNDDKKSVSLAVYPVDTQKELNEIFAEMIKLDDYDIYIASKETFESYEDKSVFLETASYTKLKKKDTDVLKDSSGRIYAVSLEDNFYIKHFGFVNPKGLYIAAASSTEDEPTQSRKNGRNLTKYIIENKDLYRQ